MSGLNEKGFSLVELIIAFSIMAVLIGILAPTLLSNIEKSKISTDISSVDVLYSAMSNAAGDPDVDLVANERTYITYNNSTGVISFTDTTAFWQKVKEYMGDKTAVQLQSNCYKGNSSADIKFYVDDITRTVQIEGRGGGVSDNKSDFQMGE